MVASINLSSNSNCSKPPKQPCASLLQTKPLTALFNDHHNFISEDCYMRLEQLMLREMATLHCKNSSHPQFALNSEILFQICQIYRDITGASAANSPPSPQDKDSTQALLLATVLKNLRPWRVMSDTEKSLSSLSLALSNVLNDPLPPSLMLPRIPTSPTSVTSASEVRHQPTTLHEEKENIPCSEDNASILAEISPWKLIHNHNLRPRQSEGYRRCLACTPRKPLSTLYISPLHSYSQPSGTKGSPLHIRNKHTKSSPRGDQNNHVDLSEKSEVISNLVKTRRDPLKPLNNSRRLNSGAVPVLR